MDIQQGQNTGVIIEPIKPTDFIAGAETGVSKQVLEEDGQFDKYLPDNECQYGGAFDSYACVSFSATNNIEIIFNWMIANFKMKEKQLKFLKDNGYINENTGKVNFSDRFTAKMSGTTIKGNSLNAVADSVRNHGLIPETKWPWPKEIVESMPMDEKWNTYFATIPQELKDLGLEFKKLFDIQYEWTIIDGVTKDVTGVAKKHLTFGPMQIAAKVCPPWNTSEVIKGCGFGTGHGTTIYGFKDQEFWKDYDHYNPYAKKLGWDYVLPYAVQFNVNQIEEEDETEQPTFKYQFNKSLQYGMISQEVNMLQKALQVLGYMKNGVFGPYGPQTAKAVLEFQLAEKVDNQESLLELKGRHFGPKTRAAINKKLK